MTMPMERTRALIFAREVLTELKDAEKHPETTPETKRAIDVVLRHFPDNGTLDYAALVAPNLFSTVAAVSR